MTNCADAARVPDEDQLTDIASILAAGILRLRKRQALPVPEESQNPAESSPKRLELSDQTVLSVVHGG